MEFYPAFIRLAGRRAVVVGGGAVAERKALTLLEAGADVAVVSPGLTPGLGKLAEAGRIAHVRRDYRAGDLKDAAVAVAATDDPETNLEAAREAGTLGILFNCASPPGAGNFIVPSSIERGGLTVAISTGGTCPALSKKLRIEIESFLGREYGPLLAFLDEARALIKERVPDQARRAEILSALVESDAAELFKTKDAETAKKEAMERLEGLVKGV